MSAVNRESTVKRMSLVASLCASLVLLAACSHSNVKESGVQKVSSQATLTEQQARTLVQPFYSFLGGKGSESAVRATLASGWQSYSDDKNSRGVDVTMKRISGPIRMMIPDLHWEIKDVSVTSKNEVVVRGEATGTPAGKMFFGAPTKNKPFKIMSIDVHTVQNGKIVKTYHVEDWAGAMRQSNAR